MSTRELEARFDSRKSFYHKAIVIEKDNAIYLRSYDTIVCGIKGPSYFRGVHVGSVLHRYWSGNYDGFGNCMMDCSPTTLRHIKEFLKQYDDEYKTTFSRNFTIDTWRNIPVENEPDIE